MTRGLSINIVACLVAGWLNWSLSKSVHAQELQPITPMENILKYKETQDPPLWRLALGPVYVSEMYQTGKDTLLLGLKENDPQLPSKEYMLVSMVTGKPFWRYEMKAKKDYNLLSVSHGNIFLVAETGETMELLTLNSKNGKSLWTYKGKFNQCSFYSFPGFNKILAEQRSGENAEIAAMDPETGKEIWNRSFRLKKENSVPGLFTEEDVLIHFFDGIQRISIENGQPFWSRTDLLFDRYDPPVQIQNDTLLISQNGNITALNLTNGKTIWAHKTDMFIINLFQMEKVFMVRSELPRSDINANYSFHLDNSWTSSERGNGVTRFSDPLTGAFIMTIHLENVSDPGQASEVMVSTLKNISKGDPKLFSGPDMKINPLLISLKRYEGMEKDSIFYQALLGTFWNPDKKKATAVMTLSSIDFLPSVAEDFQRVFETFRFSNPASMTDKWTLRS